MSETLPNLVTLEAAEQCDQKGLKKSPNVVLNQPYIQHTLHNIILFNFVLELFTHT
jgi:hypothetical protein